MGCGGGGGGEENSSTTHVLALTSMMRALVALNTASWDPGAVPLTVGCTRSRGGHAVPPGKLALKVDQAFQEGVSWGWMAS